MHVSDNSQMLQLTVKEVLGHPALDQALVFSCGSFNLSHMIMLFQHDWSLMR
jgi:hypothetical protein